MALLYPPTHLEIVAFLQKHLPLSGNAREVPFLWHTPRHATYDPSNQTTATVVLSITPTPGFYRAINNPQRPSTPLSFLHRPWSLDRKALRKGSLVLSSHASFDEHLTVGWNLELAKRIGLDLTSAVCIQGYKNNSERKIGLVAPLEMMMPRSRKSFEAQLKREFDGAGEMFHPKKKFTTDTHQLALAPPDIRTVAIMNAFHVEEIGRVLEAARSQHWIGEDEDGSSILYLTGAARDYGLTGVEEVNMPAFCVGHRACEEWGIRFLASQLRDEWPQLEVVEVFEEEFIEVKARDIKEA